MAQLVIAAAGAYIGSAAITGTVLGMTGAQIGWIAGSLLGSALAPTQKSQGPRLEDLRVSGTEYGQPIPWVAGSPRISGQIVWASERRETAKTEEVGKGGGAEYTTYTYDVDLLILLTENQIPGVSRIWSNGELVWNGTETKENVWSDLRIYTGASGQLPDPTYEAAVGAADAVAYRGRGYVFIQGLQLGSGGNIPNLTFEIGENVYTERQEFLLEISGPYDLVTDYNSGGSLVATYTNLAGGVARNNVLFPTFPDPIWDEVGGPDWYYNGLTGIFQPGGQLEIEHTVIVTIGALTRVYMIHDDTVVYLKINDVDVTSGLNTDAGYFWTFYEFTPTVNSIKLNFRVRDISTTSARAGLALAQFFIDGSAVLSPEPLPDVVQALMNRAGYDSSDFSLSTLPSGKLVRGLGVSQVSPSRATLEMLQSAFFFEASKSDKIYVRPRSVTAVASIPYDDLGTASDVSADTEPLSLNIGNELEVPAQLSLTYHNVAADYNTGTEHSDRLLTGQVSNQTVQMALGMTPAEAKGVVDALLWDSIAGLTKTTIGLPLKYAYLEPGDVIDVTNSDARRYRLRILTKRDTLPILTFECTLDDVNALTSAEITDEDYVSSTDVTKFAPTVWEAMDIPILRDADDAPGYYVAVAPDRADATDEWKGAVVVRSWDDVVYEQLVETSDQCVMGACVDVLGDWTGGNIFDETNTLTVVMQGQLSSSTRDAMLLDLSVNAMLVGSEIIRFRTASLVSSTSDGEYEYTLSGLVRGQRGTEWAMTGHASDERCVLLNTKMRRITTQTSQINVERYIKAVTFGRLLSSATGVQFTDTGVALKPFSPANARALADGSDLMLTWQRRTRLSYRYGGATPSVPLGEATEAYRIKVYDGSTLVRTENVTSATWTYAAADIAADGFVSTDTITFEIMQLSETIGEGYAATIEGTAP